MCDGAGRFVWELVEHQHGVVTHAQLLAHGFTVHSIEHRLATRRLHPIHLGVYAVGRPSLSQRGLWIAAVLCCGPGSALSHLDAAALAGIVPHHPGPIHVSVPAPVRRRHPGLTVHRRRDLAEWVETRDGIPVAAPTLTLVDLAALVPLKSLEAAVNEADALDLIDPESLRANLNRLAGRPGVAILRSLLDRLTFRLTQSELERRLIPLAVGAGLGVPETQVVVNGWKVDFYWPDLGLVVETDGLRYHRTASTQTRDRRRDQAHTAAGLTPLRLTHAQVRFEPGYVRALLVTVARKLRARRNRLVGEAAYSRVE